MISYSAGEFEIELAFTVLKRLHVFYRRDAQKFTNDFHIVRCRDFGDVINTFRCKTLMK